ncbi:hypothetical protein FOA52_002465 [Chlamydomonas sp. UWO 241]|nr:hypothetical protein FOA52_002465 [Chlamydomonas sp. UWO 241]
MRSRKDDAACSSAATDAGAAMRVLQLPAQLTLLLLMMTMMLAAGGKGADARWFPGNSRSLRSEPNGKMAKIGKDFPPQEVFGPAVHTIKRSGAGTAENPIVYFEMGCNEGQWTDQVMTEANKSGTHAVCYCFEPQPKLTNGITGEIARKWGCTLVAHPVWIKEEEMTLYQHENSQATALFAGGQWVRDGDEAVKVITIDIVQWMMENLDPSAYIHGRMDIEGAEYEVLRHMVMQGVACWFDVLDVEFHATHHKSNYKKRPADVVMPWLLSACKTKIATEVWYPEEFWDPQDEHCRKCDMFNHGVGMSEG